MSHFRVVLIEPEIPQNTGNIGRTCVATDSELHLVGPLGFDIDDKQLKRAGLDYWPHLKWFQYPNMKCWLAKVENPERIFYFTTKSKKNYYNFQFQPGDWFVFGKETKGLSPELLQSNSERCATIPQFGPVRSLNLATSVAIALYEGIRQIQTPGLPK